MRCTGSTWKAKTFGKLIKTNLFFVQTGLHLQMHRSILVYIDSDFVASSYIHNIDTLWHFSDGALEVETSWKSKFVHCVIRLHFQIMIFIWITDKDGQVLM